MYVEYPNGRFEHIEWITFFVKRKPVRFRFTAYEKKFLMEAWDAKNALYKTLWSDFDAFVQFVDRPKYWNCLIEIDVENEKYEGEVKAWLYLRKATGRN